MSTVERLKAWLGEPLFLVPQSPGTKIPMVKYTQETMESTKRDVCRVMLEHGNGAVRLGEFSGGFCAIDFDEDQSLKEFLKVNPLLETLARRKRRRGAQIGVRITGTFPGPFEVRHATETTEIDGKQVRRQLYEWRSTGNLSTVKGAHPSGCEYQVLVANPPVTLEFSKIQCPGGWPVNGEDPVMAEPHEQLGHPETFSEDNTQYFNLIKAL